MNVRYPFSKFFLNVLDYYHLSLGQLAPVGAARIMHFEIVCRSFGFDPNLTAFRRFFQLAKNGDWFTIEKTMVESAVISGTVGHTAPWKDRFFFISWKLLPFASKRDLHASLNAPPPDASLINTTLLDTLRSFSSKL